MYKFEEYQVPNRENQEEEKESVPQETSSSFAGLSNALSGSKNFISKGASALKGKLDETGVTNYLSNKLSNFTHKDSHLSHDSHGSLTSN